MVPGRVMPSARPQKRRVVDPEPDPFYKIADMLRLTPEEKDSIKARFTEVCRTDDDRSPCWRQVLVREDVARDIVAELRQRKDEIPGTDVVQQPIRYYPYKNLGAHMLGYVAEIDKERLDAFRPEGYENLTADERSKVNPLGYGLGDTLGATGVGARVGEPLARPPRLGEAHRRRARALPQRPPKPSASSTRRNGRIRSRAAISGSPSTSSSRARSKRRCGRTSRAQWSSSR